MPKINIKCDIHYYGNNKKYKQYKYIRGFKKEIYFDIIGSLPPIPDSLFSLNGMKMEEVERLWKSYHNIIIPFPHPLEFIIGIPPHGLRKFSMQLYALPKVTSMYDFKCYTLSWNIAYKNILSSSSYKDIYKIRKYMKLWNYFSKNFYTSSDLEFLVQLLILNDDYGKQDYKTYAKEKKGHGKFQNDMDDIFYYFPQLYDIIFPEFKNLPDLTLHFSQWFKKDEFSLFSPDYRTIKNARYHPPSFNEYFISNFELKD